MTIFLFLGRKKPLTRIVLGLTCPSGLESPCHACASQHGYSHRGGLDGISPKTSPQNHLLRYREFRS